MNVLLKKEVGKIFNLSIHNVDFTINKNDLNKVLFLDLFGNKLDNLDSIHIVKDSFSFFKEDEEEYEFLKKHMIYKDSSHSVPKDFFVDSNLIKNYSKYEELLEIINTKMYGISRTACCSLLNNSKENELIKQNIFLILLNQLILNKLLNCSERITNIKICYTSGTTFDCLVMFVKFNMPM